MKHVALLVFFSFLFQSLPAQEAVLVSMEDVLQKAQANNNTIAMSLQDVLMAKGDLDQTRAVLLPSVGISHTGLATTNPLMAFGSKLNQGILTPGDFNPDLLNNPSQIEDYATRVEVQQPILNLDGLHQRKAAKAKWNAAQLQSERTRQTLQLEVRRAYMQLQLGFKTVEVLRKAKTLALENKRIAQNNFRQGNLQKSDVLAVEIRVIEIDNQLQYAESNIQNLSNYLSVLMDDPAYPLLKPSDSLMVLSSEAAHGDIPESRADLQAMAMSSRAYQQMYKADKMDFLPRLNAFGTYELHDDQIFGGGQDGYVFGAALQWNLFEGGKRFGKTKKSRAEYEKATLRLQQYRAESQLELNRAKRNLEDAKNNLSLAQLAVAQAKEALRIRTNRFGQGLERTTDLLSAETQYVQKQLDYFTMVFQHNYALAYVQFLTKKGQSEEAN